MGKKILVLCLFALISLSACAAIATDELSDGPPLRRPAAARFDTFVVERGTVESIIMTSGAVSLRPVPLGFSLSGNHRMGTIHFLSGESFYEGQVLASLDVEHILEQIEIQEAALSRMRRQHSLDNRAAMIEIDLRELDYRDAIRTVAETANPLALAESERLRVSIERARLNLVHAAQNQALAESDIVTRLLELRYALEGTELIAPFNGIVIMEMSWEGGFVEEGAYVLYVMSTDERVHVEYTGAGVGQWDVARAVRKIAIINDKAFEIEQIPLTSDEHFHYAWHPRRNDPMVSASVPLRFSISAPDEELPPLGAGAAILLYSVWLEDVLRVPINAVIESNLNEFYVNKVEGGSMVPVRVNVVMTDTFAAIISGLSEGDVVFVRP